MTSPVPPKPWELADIALSEVRKHDYKVAVLPLGATEPHNTHLPYATDTLEATVIGRRACQRAWEQGGRVLLLPTIPYGTETNMTGFPFAINVNPSTMSLLLADLVESLENSGIDRIVLLNSHGGNTIKPILRELSADSSAYLFLCDWYQSIGDVYEEIFECPEDHAGEMETSLALAFFGDLVVRADDGSLLADDGQQRPFRFEALRKKWVTLSREWDLLTTNSGSGNPHAATREKGEQLMAILVDRIGGFLAELARAETDEWFPFCDRYEFPFQEPDDGE